MLVSARTRVISKNVKRFLLVGRVVRKKLTRATQLMFETVKQSNVQCPISDDKCQMKNDKCQLGLT